MIRLGICTSNYTLLEKLADIGYDYIEANLAQLFSKSEEEFQKIKALVSDSPIKVETFNCMLPGTIRIVGESTDDSVIDTYLDKAFSRASALGAKVIVFGSSGSRNLPEGYCYGTALKQLLSFLTRLSSHAARWHLDIAIEPLCRRECNFINFVSEALIVSHLSGLSNIHVLGDTYHMEENHEPLTVLEKAGDALYHLHTAQIATRSCPTAADTDYYRALFGILHGINYNRRLSVEASFNDFLRNAQEAYDVLSPLK